ncbi:MAG: aldo/keto reductase [Eubacteriales bacterium]|nr:aldo/keto reductase [Eubacteriales bacterium]
MEYNQLGKSEIIVSQVGFGVHPLGPSRRNLSPEDGAALMCYAYEKGIRFFDTAQFYHTYHYLRLALEKMRESEAFEELPVISSKSLACTYEEMQEAIEEALEETGLPYIDIFLLHQATPGYEEEREGALRALIEAKEQGKVHAIGISTHHQDQVRNAVAHPEFDVVFALYNYAGLGIRDGENAGTAEGMRDAIRCCRDAGLGVYTMKVFGGGNLTSDYQQAAAHVFVECKELIPSAMVGFTSVQEVDELLSLLDGTMESSYQPAIDEKKLQVDREDCMGCGTCVQICASGAMHYSKVDGLAEIDYDRCVGCNYCAIACPERAIVLW